MKLPMNGAASSGMSCKGSKGIANPPKAGSSGPVSGLPGEAATRRCLCIAAARPSMRPIRREISQQDWRISCTSCTGEVPHAGVIHWCSADCCCTAHGASLGQRSTGGTEPMIPGAFAYHRPKSVSEAVGLLADLGEDARPLAGGHSLIPMMKLRLASPEHLVDLRAIGDLRGVKAEG